MINFMVQYFGSPNGVLGDVDGNPKIHILLSELFHDESTEEIMCGYYDLSNEFTANQLKGFGQEEPITNSKEMIYVTSYKPETWSDDNWLKKLSQQWHTNFNI